MLLNRSLFFELRNSICPCLASAVTLMEFVTLALPSVRHAMYIEPSLNVCIAHIARDGRLVTFALRISFRHRIGSLRG